MEVYRPLRNLAATNEGRVSAKSEKTFGSRHEMIDHQKSIPNNAEVQSIQEAYQPHQRVIELKADDDEEWLKMTYRILLYRELDTIGRDLFIEQMQTHDKDREWVVNQIENSEEYSSIIAKRTELLGKYGDNIYQDNASRIESARHVLLEIANRCNINPPCIMCPRSWGHVGKTRDMDARTVKQFGHILSPEADIVFAGLGEPLMHPRIWDLIDELNGDDRKLGMITNGLLLDEKNCKASISRRIAWINVSLDAATAPTYRKIRGKDFDVVCQSVKKLSQMRTERLPYIAISMLIMKSNMKEILAFCNLAIELGVDRVQYGPLQPLVAPDEAKFTYAREGYRYMDELIHCGDNESVVKRLRDAERLCEQHGIEFLFTGDYAP